MSNLNNLSPQELSCISEVQKAPEAQRQKIFEKACNAITDKTRIALLAATLSLSSPAMAQNISENNSNYQVFYTQIVERYPKLSPEQHQFFATLYVEWLKVIDSKNTERFAASIRLIVSQTQRWWLVISLVDKMIKDGILSQNHPYTKKLIEITTELDKIWQENIAKLDQKIQQEREKQQQYKKLTEMLQWFKNM